MSDKKISSEVELFVVKTINNERDCNKQLFAQKLVEKIVFTMVGILCLGVIGALVKLVVK